MSVGRFRLCLCSTKFGSYKFGVYLTGNTQFLCFVSILYLSESPMFCSIIFRDNFTDKHEDPGPRMKMNFDMPQHPLRLKATTSNKRVGTCSLSVSSSGKQSDRLVVGGWCSLPLSACIELNQCLSIAHLHVVWSL